MSDNYSEEFPLLKKLLRTEAFRFVIVRYNHYSLVQRLKEDLKLAYPNHPTIRLDAQKIDFREFVQNYDRLQKGILFLENFEDLLKEQTNSLGAETDSMKIENKRRKTITSGLNLRRDKLAKTPNALIIFIAAADNELFMPRLLKKMPDLMSFRSLFLDLEIDRTALVNEKSAIDKLPTDAPIKQPIPTPQTQFDKNKKEIRRLQKALTEATAEDLSLILSIFPQLTRLLIENGIYDKAIIYFDEWLEIAAEKEKSDIYFDKGDTLKKMGNISMAFQTFEIALTFAEKNDEKNRVGLCYQRMGDIQKDLGNLKLGLEYFQKSFNIDKELLKSFPEDTTYKNNLAISYGNLGETHTALGNLEKALEFFEEAIVLFKELYSAYPQNVGFKNNLAISYERLGSTQEDLGNLEKALEYFEEYSKLKKELYTAYPQNVGFKNGLAISYSKLGSTHTALGDLEKALEYFELDAELTKELYTAYPQNVGFKNGLAISYEKLGETQQALGNLEKALEFFELRSALSKELYTAYPQNVGFKNGLAISYYKIGDCLQGIEKKKARFYYEQATELFRELNKAFPNYAEFKRNLDFMTNLLEAL